jgi:peptidyl-dipeptidase A
MPRARFFWMGAAVVGLVSCASQEQKEAQANLRIIRHAYLEQYRPLSIEVGRAWWDAATSGEDEAYDRRKAAEAKLADLHGNRQIFAEIKALEDSGVVRDEVLARELLVMYHSFLSKQADPELNKKIIVLEADLDKIFNTHRSQVGDKTMTENDVRKILKETPKTELAREAWTGYMEVGRKVGPKLRELVKLRNQVARKLGYENYFSMRLEMQEFDEAKVFELFDELDELTSGPFSRLKDDIDRRAAERFGLTADQLRPWHTSDLFFQEAPDLSDVDLDSIYADKDPVELSRAHYESMGWDVAAILSRSDLYEREGKSPHAFCTSIDRDQDIRVLCNVKPNAQWMDTMHHELGHGVYDQYIGVKVPFILHEPSHILSTEGVAMLFGSLTKNGEFLEKVVKVSAEDLPRYAQAARAALRAEKLIFSRWTQVMLRFEQGMYRDPDQDLNKLWWDLKKRYQQLNPPDDLSGADYGAKIHVVVAPVYYHNYMLGDLFASQVRHYAAALIGVDDPHTTCFYGSKKVAQYLRREVFEPGNVYDWRELTRRATGEDLTAKYYAELYVD